MATQQICIFAYMTSFKDCSYYFIIKRCGLFLNNYKMAEQNRDREYYSELLNGRGMGRAWQLWNAIQDVRRREEEDWGSSSLLVSLGRAGIIPRGLGGRGMIMCPGRVKGRGFPSNSLPCPGRRGRGRALPPSSPPPLEDIPTV